MRDIQAHRWRGVQRRKVKQNQRRKRHYLRLVERENISQHCFAHACVEHVMHHEEISSDLRLLRDICGINAVERCAQRGCTVWGCAARLLGRAGPSSSASIVNFNTIPCTVSGEVLFVGGNSVFCPFNLKKLAPGFDAIFIPFSHHVLPKGTFMLHELSLGRGRMRHCRHAVDPGTQQYPPQFLPGRVAGGMKITA